MSKRLVLAATLAATALAASPIAARAGDSIVVGKAQAFVWAFLPVDIGVDKGIFKKHGFDNVKIESFTGDGKIQQALIAKNIDFALAGGSGMVFSVKGATDHAIAAINGPPRSLAVGVGYDSPVKNIDQLKGKVFGVSNIGSLSDWLAKQTAVAQGWGQDGIKTVALGGLQARVAAIKTHQIDAMMMATDVILNLQEKKVLRLVYNCGDAVPHFITQVIVARDDLIKNKPDMVRRFLAGWFETVDYMAHHEAEANKFAVRILKRSPTVAKEAYEDEMPIMSRDGAFPPRAVAVIKKSFVEMGHLKTEPKDDQLFTTAFLPKKQ